MAPPRVYRILLILLTCTVGGAVSLPVVAVLILVLRGGRLLAGEIMAIAWVGAALGVSVGIVWSLPNWLARGHFILWTSLGLVVGTIMSLSTNSAVPAVVFTAAGVFVGLVSALITTGAFRNK